MIIKKFLLKRLVVRRINHGLIKPVNKGEDITIKPRQFTVKIKLMLIEMSNIMQVGTIKRKLTSNINCILRILLIN